MPKERGKTRGAQVADQRTKLLREKQLEDKKEEVSARLDKLARDVVKSENKYGKDHYLTVLKRTIFSFASQIFEQSIIISDVEQAMMTITETTSIIDETLAFTMEQVETGTKNYGFFYRWKQKRKMKKYFNSINQRIQMIYDTVFSMQDMVGKMQKSMISLSEKMNKKVRARNERAAKRGESATVALNPAEEEQLNKYRAQYGVAPTTAASGETAASSTSSTSSKPTGGSDDFSDIAM